MYTRIIRTIRDICMEAKVAVSCKTEAIVVTIISVTTVIEPEPGTIQGKLLEAQGNT